MLEEAGFDVLAYEDTADWRGRMERTTAGMLAAVDELAVERGVDAAELR